LAIEGFIHHYIWIETATAAAIEILRNSADNDNNLHYSHTIDNNSSTIPTLKPNYKRILIVDDDTDITLTFKSALEEYYHDDKRFEVYTYNNPFVALS